MAKKNITHARLSALLVLENVFSREETLLEMLPLLEEQCTDPRDLALAREIVIGTCRWLGRIHHLLYNLAPRFDKFPHSIQRILEMSAYQLLFLDRVPAYAVISEAVDMARYRQFPALTGPVNGILRSITRDPGAFPPPQKEEDFIKHLSITESHPEWLIQRWLDIWDQNEVESLCQYNNTRAPLSLRLRCGFEEAEKALQAKQITVCRDERFTDRIDISGDATATQAIFNADKWTVQDGAAMVISSVVGAKPGDMLWDACAAPGGKTFYLADQMHNRGKILASDKSEARLDKVIEQRDRLKLSCVVPYILDAAKDAPPPGFDLFDAILVDAPCTGWGTFRRHPDLRWRLQKDDSERLALLALQMIEYVKRYLRPGGILVYSTCTLSPDENEGVIKKFLQGNPDFSIDPVTPYLPEAFRDAVSPEGWITLFPPKWKIDGAFAARLKRNR